MAEGFSRFMLSGEKHIVASAGVYADGIDNIAIKVMKEDGVDITNQKSKTINSIDLNQFDIIVTVCDNARDHCVIISNKKTIHKTFRDPAIEAGVMSEKITIYRKVRDEIKNMVINMLKNYDLICQEVN